ncbi:hypothetical protein KP509_38G018100 [Ceratopteris richardii]|uniref:Uncharacterized protein n=1 Tax=Ceratopteris richardii TaxID=49495 RepID=A0A8T2Q2T3_CERRI|nr:hypothetical protein KP509_38G018100 [Ceratopteris richardii]
MQVRAKQPFHNIKQHHETVYRERYEPNDLNSSSENDSLPMEAATHSLEDGGCNSDVWENLREIFQDIDAQGGGETKEVLKKPIMKLRRLLEMHTKLRVKELTLEKVYLGLRIEREWYLRKLQAIEALIGPSPSHSQSSIAVQARTSPALSFIKAVHTILYEDNDDYTLVGSKWH